MHAYAQYVCFPILIVTTLQCTYFHTYYKGCGLCFIPHFTGEGYSWSSGIVLRGEEDGEFSFILPDNLTRDGIKFLNFSLHVPKIYKDVVELGNVSNIMIELTEPPTSECNCV